MIDIQDIWKKATELLRSQMTADCYERWIANIVPVRIDKGVDKGVEKVVMVLGVPGGMFCDWLSINYKDIIRETLRSVTADATLDVTFECGHEPPARQEPAAAEPEAEQAPSAAAPSVSVSTPHLAPQSTLQTLDRRFTFDTFVVGDNNSFAFNACRAAASQPGTNINPLFIHSSTGLGKTHLIQALAQELMLSNPSANVLYVSSEDFLNQYIEAMYKKTFATFRRKFRGLDVLLIDDVQFIGSKQGFQEEIFHTFNALYNAHKQIVMTSDRPPHEIGGLESRLVSRFEWGLTADIQQPNLETRIAIIRKKQEEQNHKLSEDVIRYVAARLKSNVRRLESGIFKLVSWASLTGITIDIPTTERLLGDIFSEETDSMLSVEEIQKTVAEFYDIRMADMTSKRRPANIALPRQIAMYLSRKMTELSLPAIADKFCRNHATVIHAIDTVKERLNSSDDFKREIGQLERKLKNV